MKYSESQYRTLAERFNKMSFTQKIITIKNNSDIMYLEVDYGNFFLRLHDQEMMLKEIDFLFQFPQTPSDKDFKALFSLLDIKIWTT